MGVPVKPMNEALGRASRMCRAKPSMKSYWLRCASSAMTTMLRRSESTGWRSPFSSGKNFWIVVKTTPPDGDRELRAQVGPVGGLDGRLAQQVAAAGEGAEELVVQVVAVGDDDDRRVPHRRVQDHAARIEGHRQALARPLGVPDDADAPVARLAPGLRARLVAPRASRLTCWAPRAGRAQRLLDRRVDRVELVVAGHLLDDRAVAAAVPRVLEHDEVAQQVEKAARSNTPASTTSSSGMRGGGILPPVDRAPGLEPLPARAERADARADAVGDDERRVGREERGDLRLVGLELLEGRLDRGVLVGRVLELDHGERQAVDEEHDVGPPRVLPLGDGELVDRQPVVVLRAVEVDDPRLLAGDGAVLAAVLDGDAVDQHPVDGAVALQKGGRVDARELAEGVLEGFGREGGIEASERGAKAACEDDVAVGGSVRSAAGWPKAMSGPWRTV